MTRLYGPWRGRFALMASCACGCPYVVHTAMDWTRMSKPDAIRESSCGWCECVRFTTERQASLFTEPELTGRTVDHEGNRV